MRNGSGDIMEAEPKNDAPAAPRPELPLFYHGPNRCGPICTVGCGFR